MQLIDSLLCKPVILEVFDRYLYFSDSRNPMAAFMKNGQFDEQRIRNSLMIRAKATVAERMDQLNISLKSMCTMFLGNIRSGNMKCKQAQFSIKYIDESKDKLHKDMTKLVASVFQV